MLLCEWCLFYDKYCKMTANYVILCIFYFYNERMFLVGNTECQSFVNCYLKEINAFKSVFY